MFIHPSRAAGDVTISRFEKGELVAVEVRPAGTVETAKVAAEDLRGKPGPKKGKRKPDPDRFADSENYY